MGRTLERHLDQINKIMEIEPGDGLQDAYTTLSRLYRKRGIAGLHAILQYTVAAYLYKKGYDINVEMLLEDGLRADIYGEAPWGRIIVEVETGFIPHHLILHGESYLKARTSYKLLLYSHHADEFAIAIPGSLDPLSVIPDWALKNPENRGQADIDEASILLRTYYPHRLELLKKLNTARLHSIYTIRFDHARVHVKELKADEVRPSSSSMYMYII